MNAGISNALVKPHIDALFGTVRADELREVLPSKKPHEREILILEGLAQAIKEMGGTFVLPFRFKRGSRTSHSLVFVSKHFKGYEIMKNIMAKESSTEDQGIASFAYSPADETTPLLFSLSRPFDALQQMLLEEYAGETKTMNEIYLDHSVDTPYVSRNYKDALREMESKGLIVANPPAANRKKNTFADHVSVTFP